MDDDRQTGPAPIPAFADAGEGAHDAASGVAAALARDDRPRGAYETEQNLLLRALPPEEYALILPHLTPVRLQMRDVLVEPDVPMHDVWFPREGVGSVIASEQEGGNVEVGTVGPEGFIGLPVLNGTDRMPYRVFVQVEGHGWRMTADALRQIVDERPVVRRLFLRYSQYFMDQVSQHAACNQLHSLEERCARWLLMTHDRVPGDSFDLTHEFLALMLGVRRAGVTVAMGAMQTAGIVRYTRGRMTILDRARLEGASCGCYRITRNALDRLIAS